MSPHKLEYVVPARHLAGAYAALQLVGLRAVAAGVVGSMARLTVSSLAGDPPLSRGERALLELYGTLAEDEEAR